MCLCIAAGKMSGKENVERRYAFSGTDTDGKVDGKLTVTQVTHFKRKSPRTVDDVYAVEEQYADGFAGRCFVLVKVQHDGDTETVAGVESLRRVGEVRECHLHDDGAYVCSCQDQYKSGAVCIHVLALRQLLVDLGDAEATELYSYRTGETVAA